MTSGSVWLPGQVEAPLEHVALHDEPEAEFALGRTLGGRPDVDHQRALGLQAIELFGLDPLQCGAGVGQEIVGAADGHRSVTREAAATPPVSASTPCSPSASSNSPLPSSVHATSRTTSRSPATS